jgi:undecaprenyl-diphosphatase
MNQLDKKTGVKLSATEFIIASAFLLLSIALFTFIADEIVVEDKNSFDYEIFSWFAGFTTDFHTKIALLFTFFGSPFFMVPAYLSVMFYYARQQKKKEAILIGVVALISVLSVFLLKDIFHRHRPPLPLLREAKGYSFPIGHSLSGFTFSGIMIYLIFKSNILRYRKWIFAILLFLFAMLIGMSRIYLRVHYPSDVIGGLLVTSVWLSLTFLAVIEVEKRQLRP